MYQLDKISDATKMIEKKKPKMKLTEVFVGMKKIKLPKKK